MRIAMLLPSLANTGPGIVAKELCERYRHKGYQCKVFYFDDIVQLQMPCPTERISFWQSIDFSQWNVIHSHMYRPDAYVWYHLHMKRIPPVVKLVTTLHQPISYAALHTNYSWLQSLAGGFLWQRFITAFDRVIVLNGDTAKLFNKKNVEDKIFIIYNGRNIIPRHIDDNEVYDIKLLKRKYKIIGTVSSITKRKGLNQIVKALQYLPDYAFVAVGDGPQLQELQQLADRLGVQDRCIWVGYRENATEYLSLFDIFVMCTYSEGFPLALIEAAAYGLPTVLSDIPILKSIIGEPNASFYHLEDINDLVARIQYVYLKREEYSENICRYYEQNLTADMMADNYLKLYSSILTR